MTAKVERKASGARRALDRRIMASISPLPPPEEVFVDWLMSLPADRCLETAARHQIELIDRSAVFLHPDVRSLRLLLVAVAGECELNINGP